MAHAVWNGASMEIVDDDEDDLIDVESNPFLSRVVDRDPNAADAFNRFEGGAPVPVDIDEDRELGDEFEHEVVPRLERASIGADGGLVGDLSRLKREHEIKDQQEAVLAPPRRITPESARSGLLGNSIVVPAVSVGGRSPPGLQLVVFWEGLSIEAVPVSIALTPNSSLAAASSSGTTVRPFARIEFGTHNGRGVVDVDIGMGTQFVLPASSVFVSVGMDQGDNDFRIAGHISFFSTARATPVTRTRYLTQAAANTTAITRPNYACSLIGFLRDVVAAQYRLAFRDADAVVIGRFTLSSNEFFREPIPLPADCVDINVTNDGAGAGEARAIFGLAL